MKTGIPNPLNLYLIRHGETEWSLTHQHTGRTDISLTTNGESEARELGKHLRDIPFSHVLTSPLKRAQQTCALVGLDQVPEIEPDLAELTKIVPFPVEDMLRTNGGNYSNVADWQPYVVKDGLSITGQNPASSEPAAKELLEKLSLLANVK